jgi:hypothetical protein
VESIAFYEMQSVQRCMLEMGAPLRTVGHVTEHGNDLPNGLHRGVSPYNLRSAELSSTKEYRSTYTTKTAVVIPSKILARFSSTREYKTSKRRGSNKGTSENDDGVSEERGEG